MHTYQFSQYGLQLHPIFPNQNALKQPSWGGGKVCFFFILSPVFGHPWAGQLTGLRQCLYLTSPLVMSTDLQTPRLPRTAKLAYLKFIITSAKEDL